MKTLELRIIERNEYSLIVALAKRIGVLPETYCDLEYAALLSMNSAIVGVFLDETLIATQGYVKRSSSTAIVTDYMCADPEFGLQATIQMLDLLIKQMEQDSVFCFFAFAINERLTKLYRYLGYTEVSELQYVSFLPFLNKTFNLKCSSSHRLRGTRNAEFLEYNNGENIAKINLEKFECILFDSKTCEQLQQTKLPIDVRLARRKIGNTEEIIKLNDDISYDKENGSIHFLERNLILYPPLFGRKIHPRFVIFSGDFHPNPEVEIISDDRQKIIYHDANCKAQIYLKRETAKFYSISVCCSSEDSSLRMHFSAPKSLHPEDLFPDFRRIKDYYVEEDCIQMFLHSESNHMSISLRSGF